MNNWLIDILCSFTRSFGAGGCPSKTEVRSSSLVGALYSEPTLELQKIARKNQSS